MRADSETYDQMIQVRLKIQSPAQLTPTLHVPKGPSLNCSEAQTIYKCVRAEKNRIATFKRQPDLWSKVIVAVRESEQPCGIK